MARVQPCGDPAFCDAMETWPTRACLSIWLQTIMKTNHIAVLLVIIGLPIYAYQDAKYVVNDDEQVVVTQFGKVSGKVHSVPGEYFKIPIIQETHYFKKTGYVSDSSQEIPTSDKKILVLRTRSFWQISDPIKFYENLNSYELAKKLVLDCTGDAERQVVTSNKMADIIGDTLLNEFVDMKCKREIENQIVAISRPQLSKAGIHLSHIEARSTYPANK